MKLGSIDRRLLTVLLIVFVNRLGSSLILPILPLYAERQFQMSPQTIALLVVIPALGLVRWRRDQAVGQR